VTQFTHVSRHFGVYCRKQKKIVYGKLFIKCGPKNPPKIVNVFMVFFLFLVFALFSKTSFLDV
jgi:hypothetical protein